MWRLLLFFSVAAQAAVHPLGREFRAEGVVEGGRAVMASLVAMRLVTVGKGLERWEVEFRDPAGARAVVPHVQVEYLKEESFERQDGSKAVARPARLVFRLRNIHTNPLTKASLQKMLFKSRIATALVQYPPIEDGDFALQWTFKQDVRFALYQPSPQGGRLVLDVKTL